MYVGGWRKSKMEGRGVNANEDGSVISGDSLSLSFSLFSHIYYIQTLSLVVVVVVVMDDAPCHPSITISLCMYMCVYVCVFMCVCMQVPSARARCMAKQ